MSDELTDDELTCLRWCARLDRAPDRIGFLGPTVKRHGPVPEYASAVAKGLVRCVEPMAPVYRGGAAPFGYWITAEGRRALAAARRSAAAPTAAKQPQDRS